MEVEWFCQVMGSEVGPLTQSQLVDMVRDHKVTPEDLVRRNSSPWVAAFEVKGLFAAAAKPAKSDRQAASKPPSDDVASTIQVTRRNSPASTAKASTPQPAASTPTETLRKNPSDRVPDEQCTEADWFCIASGEKQGPLSFEELQSLLQAGRLRLTDRVWRSSSPKFRKAAEVEGLG